MELLKEPVPVPLDVLLLAVVGFCEVLQHTPLVVTDEPPSEITLPPDAAVVRVIMLTALVLIVGTERACGVEKET